MAERGGRPPHLADATALEQWAERYGARFEFARLVRRLIRQTNDQVPSLQMRAAEGTDFRGYDGQVQALKGTPFVPSGDSVWELGVGEDPARKANEDYRTRTENSLGVDKSKTTFVFATARRWSGRTEWAREKRAEGEWADVLAFDADDIDTAFDEAPAVQFWFSELIGLPVDGVRTIENWWDAFSRTTQPSLTPGLVLAGRADEAAKLLRLLEEETRITTVSAASTDEVLAFVAATLLSSPEPGRSDLLARTLIVYDAVSLRRLDATTDLLVLLPYEDELRREAQLVHSHHVILLAPHDVPGGINVPSVDRDEFAAELTMAGVEETAAEKLARAAHRSLVAFQAESPRGARLRGWAEAFSSKAVRRAWLAGGWQEAKSGDTDALALLFGASYDDSRDTLEPFASGEDPIFTVVGGTWGLTSAEQAWRFGGGQLNGSDFAALETVIQTVLGAVDPALELPVEERWMAGFHGKTRIHSSDLRRGLATTLAACGAFGQETQIGSLGTAADWAQGVVAQLLRRANEDRNGELWASLSDVLPLLAEAAPEAFLRAVRDGVTRQSEPVLAAMFLDREDLPSITVSSPHTGLLWALENLAWSEEHAALAIKLLAQLAEIDPGGRLSNRPLNSLADIFRTWLPQTSLSAERRLAVLDGLRRDHPQIAWKLMLTLLPEPHAVGSYTHSPHFREWKPEKEGVTYAELWEMGSAVIERLLEDARTAPARWTDLVERLDDFPPPERASALKQLRDLAESKDLDRELREQLWNQLDKMIRRHKKFESADWALPPGELDQVAAVADSFMPSDPVVAHLWLFDEHWPDIGDERLEYHEEEERLNEARAAAAQEVLAAEGFDGLIRLAEAVEIAGFVGVAAAAHASEELDGRILPLLDSQNAKHASLAAGYSYQRVTAGDQKWLKRALHQLSGRPLAQARLLQGSNDLPETWRLLAELGPEVEEAYWHEFTTMGRGPDFALVNEAAKSLIKFGRPIAALDLMNLYVRKEDRRVSPELIIDALEQLIGLPADHPEGRRVSTYELEGLLEYLRASDVDDERLAVLEWQLLPALGYDARSPALERRLARDPAFFVELVSLIYKPRSAEASEDVDEKTQQIASNAYRLLSQWKIVPGSTEEAGEVDGERLSAWTDEARELLAAADRREVGDSQIGHVFAYARGDEDDTWPTRPVRDLIERLASPNLEEGFEIEMYNKRGATSRGLTEGGAQERALAGKYRGLAGLIRDAWPRTAAVLNSLARTYEREARMHDNEVERFREGLDH
jgi:hypothetical protein